MSRKNTYIHTTFFTIFLCLNECIKLLDPLHLERDATHKLQYNMSTLAPKGRKQLEMTSCAHTNTDQNGISFKFNYFLITTL
jgi:hypothetical protein